MLMTQSPRHTGGVFTTINNTFELCLFMMKNLPGSYDREINKGHKYLWILAAVFAIAVASAIALYFIIRSDNKTGPTGQKLNNSISSYENKYVGRSIKIDTTNIKAPWVLQNGSESSFILNNSTCKASISSSNDVPALLNAGQTLNSAVNNKLEEIKNSSKDQSLIIGETTSSKIDSNNGDIEFMIKDSEYKAKDDITHQANVYGQWLGEYQLFIVVDCNKTDYLESKQEISDFINNLSLRIN